MQILVVFVREIIRAITRSCDQSVFARPQRVRDGQGRRRRIMGGKRANDIRNHRVTDCGACSVVDKNMIRRIRCQRIQPIFDGCIARGAPVARMTSFRSAVSISSGCKTTQILSMSG